MDNKCLKSKAVTAHEKSIYIRQSDKLTNCTKCVQTDKFEKNTNKWN